MNRLSILFLLLVTLMLSCAKPIARFSYSGETTAPAKLSFDNQSKKAENYEWDFGDGNSSTESSPEHAYSASGKYIVTLKARKGKKTVSTQQTIIVDAPEQCLVEIETEYGNMTVLLYDATPQHRDNFIKLAEEGYYDDLLFHRVINGFMIQGGDPKSRTAKEGEALGSGGPGYQIPAEFVDSLVHVKGALAAARTNNPEKKSSGSQFYIVQGSPVSERQLALFEARKDIHYTKSQRDKYLDQGGTPQLDREYTVFGMVIDGIEVIDKIAAVATNERDRPKQNVKMKMKVIK